MNKLLRPWITVAFAALALGACSLQTLDEQPQRLPLGIESTHQLTEEEAWDLYYQYIHDGIDPCDPPPDPWHPFMLYGCCEISEEPEAYEEMPSD